MPHGTGGTCPSSFLERICRLNERQLPFTSPLNSFQDLPRGGFVFIWSSSRGPGGRWPIWPWGDALGEIGLQLQSTSLERSHLAFWAASLVAVYISSVAGGRGFAAEDFPVRPLLPSWPCGRTSGAFAQSLDEC